MSKDRKLNFSALAAAIDRRDFDWLAKQGEDVTKEFGPPSLRFASGVQGNRHALYTLWLINRRVNQHFFALDKDLSYRLLASCGTGQPMRREWIAGRRAATDNAALRFMAEYYPDASEDEVRILLSLHSRTSFAQFVADCGMDKERVKACVNAYDKLEL